MYGKIWNAISECAMTFQIMTFAEPTYTSLFHHPGQHLTSVEALINKVHNLELWVAIPEPTC